MNKDADICSDSLPVACVVCSSTQHLKRCTRCKQNVYCSREHQIKDWPEHKLTCGQSVNNNNTVRSSRGNAISTENELAHNYFEFNVRPFKNTKFNTPNSYREMELAEFVIDYINKNNFCVVDGVFKELHLNDVISEIKSLNNDGHLVFGQLSGGRTSGENELMVTETTIRNDKIHWAEGNEARHPNINRVVKKMDSIVSSLNPLLENRYFINGRTKVMVACYPGNGSYYRRHVDNPSGDGRVITCILYLNKDWKPETDGGVLRIFSADDSSKNVDIAPLYNRLLLFWSDRRNPHEVQPAFRERYAITVWFFDKEERRKVKEEISANGVTAVKEELVFLELEKKEKEKNILSKKIEEEAERAIKSLTEEELKAIYTLVRDSDNAVDVLTRLGIASSIQQYLLEELRRKYVDPSI